MKILAIVLGLLVVLAVPLLYLMFYGMQDIRRMVIREVDLALVPDGTYRGSYHKGRWTYDVKVEIRDHRIASIKNTNPRTASLGFDEAAEAAIVEQQRIGIDVVSGASLNTKAFEKAVEVALSSAPPSAPNPR